MSKKFGEILKKVRETAKNPSLSQSELAAKLELKSYKQIKRYEDGMIPPLDKLIKLCDIFEYDFLSPATDGRCTILDYFNEEINDNAGVPYKIEKGIPLPSLRIVSGDSDTKEQQNTQPKPGIAELVEEIKKLTDTVSKGFSSHVEAKRTAEVPPPQRKKFRQVPPDDSKPGTSRIYKPGKGDQTGNDEQESNESK